MLKLRNIKHNVLNAKLHAKRSGYCCRSRQGGTVTIATNMAGRGTDIKFQKMQAGLPLWLETERHESRRVDRQLRGRAATVRATGKFTVFKVLKITSCACSVANALHPYGSHGLKKGRWYNTAWSPKSIERAQKKWKGTISERVATDWIRWCDECAAGCDFTAAAATRCMAISWAIDIANTIFEIANSIGGRVSSVTRPRRI